MTRDEYKAHVLRSADEDARRIVACVNACEGISTEQLESWLCMSRPIRKSLEELKAEADREAKQCDDLLRYLKEARRTLEMWKDVAPAVSLCADIDAAIARATGEQP